MAQHGGRDDRNFLRDWHPQAAEHEHGEHAEVRKVVEELLESLHGVLTKVSSDMDGYTRKTSTAVTRGTSPPDQVPKNTETFIVRESRLLRPKSGCGVSPEIEAGLMEYPVPGLDLHLDLGVRGPDDPHGTPHNVRPFLARPEPPEWTLARPRFESLP